MNKWKWGAIATIAVGLISIPLLQQGQESTVSNREKQVFKDQTVIGKQKDNLNQRINNNNEEGSDLPGWLEAKLKNYEEKLPDLLERTRGTVLYVPADKNNPFDFDKWTVEYSSKNTKQQSGSSSIINLEMFAKTGEIINYRYHQNAFAPNKTNETVPDEKAIEVATDFIQMNYGKDAEYFTKPQIFGRSYDGTLGNVKIVGFYRLIHGIPYDLLFTTVKVNHEGRIVSVWASPLHQEDVPKLPDPESAMTEQQARVRWGHLQNVELVYFDFSTFNSIISEEKRKIGTELIYQPTYFGTIDAISGERIGISIDEQEPQLVTFAGKGTMPLLKTKEDVANTIQKLFGEKLTAQQLNDIEQRGTSMDWFVDIEGSSYFFEIENGSIVYMNAQRSETESTENPTFITEEEAYQSMIQFLEKISSEKELLLRNVSTPDDKLIPDWVDKSKIKEIGYSSYTFEFMNTFQGIPVQGKPIRIHVDAATGQISTAQLNGLSIDKKKLPSVKPAITKEEAKKRILDNQVLQLAYYWEQYDTQRAPEPRIFWGLAPTSESSYLDANTGKWISITLN
ncbi:YcdB/YcdC domain-containing protein [Brevibacillus daliensis]|uniref:YcdB/YcdC domain-containing protein n=1 Tax=Brevibacillus daliensis TaxID=2892995 RepID=UPI001E35866F|nr:YcdB/YcdC domain-containing protein [Brevibacillus daliensis]